jgi:hypothetical protein
MKHAVTTLWIICCCVTAAAIAEEADSDIWSEASPDKRLLATIRFVPNPDKNWRAFDELKITVFRRGRDGKPGQILASTAIGGCFLQCAHWSPDSQFLLFTTSLARGAHGGWHFDPFVYCAADHSFRSGLEGKSGDVVAAEFRFDSPDIAVLTVRDEDAPSPSTEEMPSKEVKVSLSKVSDALERRDSSEETVSKEKGLKSENGNVKARIAFVNRSKQAVKVYWLDYRGQRVFYKKLKPAESYTQDTYMTHPWLVTDLHDNAWEVYMPTVQPRTVIITAPKKR